MKNDPYSRGNKLFLALMTLALFLFGFLMGFCIGKLYQIPKENSSKAILEAPRGDLVLVQNLYIEASYPHYYNKPRLHSALAEQIIHCESRGLQSARGKAGEIGIAQFMPTTWKWMTDLADYDGDIYNEEDQRYMLDWALENGLESHWTCYHLITKK